MKGLTPSHFSFGRPRASLLNKSTMRVLPAPGRLLREVVKSRKGRIFKPAPRKKAVHITEGAIGSSICVPVMMDEKIIGVLYHDNRLLLNAFKESDLTLIAYFAALASLDLDGAKAHQEIQRLQQKA